jgi:Helix-turn-helix domain
MERGNDLSAKIKSLRELTKQYTGNGAAKQRTRLLEALHLHGNITTIEAREGLDILSPAPRIMELRNAGYFIDTVWSTVETMLGKTHRIGRYVLRSRQSEMFADAEELHG